jgi:hypothetical protein
MAATFSVPACGWNVGTCGWLASGLTDGSISIKPGTTSGGRPGLWVYWGGDKQGCLAIWNEFGLTEEECRGADRFALYHGAGGLGFAGGLPLTPAAERVLRTMAQLWCEEANDRRLNDICSGMPVIEVH